MRLAERIGSVFVIGFAAAIFGCGDAPENLSTVSGQVTLAGQPLEGALVEFIPDEAGSPSYGRTDAQGKYELRFNREHEGATIGKNQVRISTYDAGDPEGEPPRPAVPEKVPARYNVKTELTKEVAAGSNTIDFPLEGGGEIISPEQLSKRDE